MKWILILLAVLLIVYIVLPMLRGMTTRYGLVAPGGGNGTGAEHQILV